MFGKKKKKEEAKKEELEKLKSKVQQPTQQPALQPQVVQPQQGLSPFFIGEKVRVERQKTIQAGSGQVIKLPEMEIVDTLNIVYQLTIDDLIEIARCEGNISKKIKELIVKQFRK